MSLLLPEKEPDHGSPTVETRDLKPTASEGREVTQKEIAIGKLRAIQLHPAIDPDVRALVKEAEDVVRLIEEKPPPPKRRSQLKK